MALHAQRVYIAARQKSRIWRAMRRVARGATFGLYRGMLIDKRTCRFGVALDADGIALGSRMQTLCLEGSMRIMAIAAFHQAFVHLVVEGLGEIRLDICVAPVAQRWLGCLEQVLLFALYVNPVAIEAAYVCLSVGGALKVGVLPLVASQALVVNLLGVGLGKAEDLGHISAAVDVGLARSVTTLTRGGFIAVH